MATYKTEKYYRINLFLDRGFIKLARAAVQKHVVDSTPPGHNPNPWRLEDFLRQNNQAIFHYPNGKKRNLCEEHKHLLFPTNQNKPNLEQWDLTLLCFVLTELCQFSQNAKDDVKVVKKIRNHMCHTADASLSDTEYADYSSRIKGVIGRFLAWLNDATIAQEVNNIIQDIENGSQTHIQELFRNVEERQNSERELATAVNNLSLETKYGFAEVIKNQKEIMDRLERLEQNGKNIQPPDLKVTMRVINCENEGDICDKLVDCFNKESKSPTEEPLKQTLRKSMSKLIKDDVKVISVTKECVAIVLRCCSFESLHRLWSHCVNGEVTRLFKPVEQCLRGLPGCEHVELEVGVTEGEFLRCVNFMISELEEEIVNPKPSCTATVLHKLQEKKKHLQPKDKHAMFSLPKTLGASPPSIREGLAMKIVIKPTTFEHVMHTLESVESTEYKDELRSISDVLQKKLKQRRKVDIKVTIENKTELKQAYEASLHMRTHEVTSVMSFEKCLVHDGELSNMFCQEDETTGCKKCMAQNHRSCAGIIPRSSLHTNTGITQMKTTHSNKLPQIGRKSGQNPDGRSNGGTQFDKQLQIQFSKQKQASRKLGAKHGKIDFGQMHDTKLKSSNYMANVQAYHKLQTQNSTFDKLYESNKITKQLPQEIQPLTDDGQGSETCKQHQGLYPEGMIRNVNVRLPSDKRTCDIRAMCFLSDGRILMSDFTNNKLKLLDSNLSMIHHCDFQYCPNGICMINDTEAAVVVGYRDIQFVSVVDKIEKVGKIQLDPYCVGLVYCDGELYVSDGLTNIHVYAFKHQDSVAATALNVYIIKYSVAYWCMDSLCW